jgi:membrane-associated phospholipid phosphatase
MNKFAHLVSWVFQPVLMPLFGALIFLNLPFYSFRLLPEPIFWYVIICNTLFTILLPVLIIFLLYRYAMIKSIGLEHREDRIYPIIFAIAFHMANFYFITRAQLPGPYLFFLMAGVFSLFLSLLVTYYWKISLHMIGVGGLCGGFLALAIIWPVDLRFLIAFLFVIAGVVGTARLILNAHNPTQVVVGFFTGLIPQLAVVYWVG